MDNMANSVLKLKDMIKSQEKKISFPEKNDFQSIQLIPHKGYSDESRLGQNLKVTVSEISQESNWNCNLDSIHSSVEDLKQSLKNQDTQVIRLEAEKKELREELKKIEKDLKKQKIILKAERDAFAQFKRDNCGSDESLTAEDNKDVVEEKRKVSQELLKSKSELTHYKQIYLEQSHTLARLAKQEKILKNMNLSLKGKLVQQESCFNKFILGMAVRFEKSRQEFNGLVTNKYDTYSNTALKPIILKTIVRNSRLAFDNAMLKLQLNALKQPLVDSEFEQTNFKNRPASVTSLSSKDCCVKLSPSFCNTLEQLKNIKNNNLRQSSLRTKRNGKTKDTRLLNISINSSTLQFSSNESVRLGRRHVPKSNSRAQLPRTQSEPRLGQK